MPLNTRRLLLPVLLALPLACLALDNGLARTPQMGWNSWNHFACNVNETVIKQAADALVGSGLAKLGYNYVNVDDCWAWQRDKDGNIQADPHTFPSGMAALADYVHSKGLLFGLYSDAGNLTCALRPGSLGYEKQDAASYASWGVDYLKYDNCNNQGISPKKRYPVMRDALNATGRPIFYSMCEWGRDDPAEWAMQVGNSWRTTQDIKDNWDSMLYNLDHNPGFGSGPGGWNDPDMLEVGNGGMTTTEYVAHFSLWAALKAPLLIGCNLHAMSQATKNILSAEEVIAVNQDSLGAQAKKVWVSTDGSKEVYAGPLADGSTVAVLFNRGAAAATINASWSVLGIPSTSSVVARDLWTRSDIGTFSASFSANVASHGVVMVKLTTVKHTIKKASSEGKAAARRSARAAREKRMHLRALAKARAVQAAATASKSDAGEEVAKLWKDVV